MQVLTWSLGLVMALGLSGCGGGGGGTAVDTVTGILVDAPVQGVTYACSSGTGGTTNVAGEYTCNVGDTVTFSVGSTILGTTAASTGAIDPYDLYPNDAAAALNVAQLLQSLAVAGDLSSSFVIDTDKVAELETALAGSTLDVTADDFDTVAGNAMSSTPSVTLVTEAEAEAHMEENGVEVPATDTTAPTFTSASAVSVAENNTATGLTVTTDDAGATLTLGGTDAALFDFTGHVLSFKTAADYETDPHTYNVTVTAEDAAGNTATQNITVTVTDVDETIPDTTPPTFTSVATKSSAENNTVTGLTITTDEAATITISGGADAALFSLDVNNALSFITTPDFEIPGDANGDNTYEVTVTAEDAAGNTATQNITVMVTDVDETIPDTTPPAFTSAATKAVVENTTATGLTVITDEAATITISGGADAVRFSLNAGVLSFNAAPDFDVPGDANGDNVYEVAVTAEDATGNTATQNITVTVTDVADVVAILSDTTVDVDENATAGTAVGSVTISDSGDNAITAITLSGTGSANFTAGTDGAITVAAGAVLDYETTMVYNLTAVATNGAGDSAGVNVTINVNDVADVVATLSDTTVDVDENATAGTAVGSVTISDSGDSAITAITLGGTGSANFTAGTDGAITVAAGAALDYETTTIYNLTAVATNGAGDSASASVTINVSDVDDTAPVFTSAATASVVENTTATGLTVTTDDANATLTLGGTDAAWFALNAGVLSFNAAPDFEAPTDADANNAYEVTVTAEDAVGNTATQDITVTVTDVDDTGPVFTSSPTLSVVENTVVIGTVTTDDENATLSIAGGVDSVRFDLVGGQLSFENPKDFEAPDDNNTDNNYEVIVRAQDLAGNTTDQNITVTVTDDPADTVAPTFTSSSTVNVIENTRWVIKIATDDIADTIALSGGADVALFSLDSSNKLRFIAAPDFELPGDAGADNVYNVTVTAMDAFNGLTADQDINITVTDAGETVITTTFKTGQVLSYDENGTEVVDGSLEDDGFHQSGTAHDFTRNADDTVSDNVTNLMWQDDANITYKPWVTTDNFNANKFTDTSGDTAATYCENLELGGYTDWRLPTVYELITILDFGTYNPTIDTTVFQNTASNYYWSATTYADEASQAWAVAFLNGFTKPQVKSTSSDKSVRCVREMP